MHTLITGIIRQLKRSVDYADVRIVTSSHERLVVENGVVKRIATSHNRGCGIRAFHRGGWGFAATHYLTPPRLRQTAADAVAIAKQAADACRSTTRLAPLPPQRGTFTSRWIIDPFTVPIEKKLDYLLWACHELRDNPHISVAIAELAFYRTEKLFASTEGSFIEQTMIESGASLEAVATLGHEMQRRTYPTSHHGATTQAGYEYVKELDLVGGAKKIRGEVVSLLRAKECPTKVTTVILDSDQVIMQLHESCGHPAELDRVFGEEISLAGGSFLTTDKLGRFRYGSPLVSITADATLPGGLGTFGYDDEGVLAQRAPIVERGRFVGYLSSRETAARLQRHSSGAMRASDWSVIPLIRMTNVNLEPGTGTLQDLIADTKDGILIATNKSWSIDDLRLNFQFGNEIAWEIKRGHLGQPLKNPVYTGITPEFWGRCSGVAGPEAWRLWGVTNCGKGEPMQSIHVGHGASPARFEHVQIGSGRS